MGLAEGKIQAIRKIKITASKQETELMQKQNDILIKKGLPFYEKIKRAISSDGMTYVWFDMTKHSHDFITGIELSHATESHPLFRDLSKSGYEAFKSDHCKLVIWGIRERKKKTAISDLKIAFDIAEENQLTVDGYQKIDINLREFDMPEIYLFVKRIDKLDQVAALNTNAILSEVESVQKLMKERPQDTALKELYKKLHKKLKSAVVVEDTVAINNPLKYAIDLLAMNNDDLNKWMDVFQIIDKEQNTRVTLDEIFMWLERPPTTYSQHVFRSLDALDSQDQIEFGDFVRCVSVYCFFGPEQILR